MVIKSAERRWATPWVVDPFQSRGAQVHFKKKL